MTTSRSEVADQFKGQMFGDMTIVDAEASEGTSDDGRQNIYLDLVFNDLPGDRWQPEAIRLLRERITALSKSLGVTVSLVVSHESAPKYRDGSPIYRP